MEYVSDVPFTIPDRVNTLPWKLEEVVIPTKSLSSGGFVVDPIGFFPGGASENVISFSTIL